MRRIIPLFLLLALSTTAFISEAHAQNSDPEALTMLRKISDKYATYRAMSMDFKLIIDDLSTDQDEVKTGQLWLQDKKFRLAMDDQLIVCDNQTIWTYLKDVNELQINFFEEDENFLTPSQLFQMAEQDYFAVLGETLNEGSRKIQVIELSPRDKELSYYKIKLFVNQADLTVTKGVIMDKNGVHFVYSLSNFVANPGIEANLFSFDESAYDGIDVIDLRE